MKAFSRFSCEYFEDEIGSIKQIRMGPNVPIK
jgi:hypothetical protein